MTAKPAVLIESYNAERSWDKWSIHFDNVAEVNEWTFAQKLKWLEVTAKPAVLTESYNAERLWDVWTSAQKLKWLKVQLTGHTQKAFPCLPEHSWATLEAVQRLLRNDLSQNVNKAIIRPNLRSIRKG